LNAKDENDWAPLHLAADNGHLRVVEYLVNQKADINAKNTSVEFLYLIGLLFIMLLIMVFLVLLNSSRVKEDNKSEEDQKTYSLYFWR